MGNTEAPPTWSPEMAHDNIYPYILREYLRDFSRWMSATKVAPERQGALLALAIGGAGRTVADELPDTLLTSGAVADIGNGQGAVQTDRQSGGQTGRQTDRRTDRQADRQTHR